MPSIYQINTSKPDRSMMRDSSMNVPLDCQCRIEKSPSALEFFYKKIVYISLMSKSSGNRLIERWNEALPNNLYHPVLGSSQRIRDF